MNIITDTDALAAFIKEISGSPFVAVDTEFMRETTYWPKLCLVQVASRDHAAIIDPLAGEDLDLSPLLALMQDPTVVKVFHAARQDIEIFVKLSGKVPAPLFDTQIAAMVLGFGEQIAYDQLVHRVLGARIDKSSQFTNWEKRPLKPAQLAYALADVTHLSAVYEHLKAMLHEKGRADWVAEEMAALTAPEVYSTQPEDAWQRLKMKAKRPVELAVLKAVAAVREEEAQTRDVPRGRVLKDDAIYEVAARCPRTREALAELRTFPKGLERSRLGQRILDTVDAVCTVPEEELPEIPRRKPSAEGTSAAVELLKVLLKLVAERHGVAPRVVATVDDLEALANAPDAPHPVTAGWRREVFGEAALRLLSGGSAIGFDGRRVRLVDLEAPLATEAPKKKRRRKRKPKAETDGGSEAAVEDTTDATAEATAEAATRTEEN